MRNKRPLEMLIGGIILVVGLVLVTFAIINLRRSDETELTRIVASNYIGYDIARAVTGKPEEVSMLLKPGAEMHSFEPTPEDILKIKNAELFIYVGGESEKWIEEILENNEIPSEKTLRLMDLVELKDEEIVEGMEEGAPDEESAEHEEYDEHIWTSPTNMRQLIDGVRMKLTMIDPATSKQYGMNASRYESRFVDIDRKVREIVSSSNKNELVFADRFPFRYFVDEYDIKYYAAFPGCAEQTEASASTIAFLIKKVREDGIGVVLKTELTSDKLAKTISEETGAKIMTLNAGHNISAEDFRKGVRYADIMEENIEVLKEALK